MVADIQVAFRGQYHFVEDRPSGQRHTSRRLVSGPLGVGLERCGFDYAANGFAAEREDGAAQKKQRNKVGYCHQHCRYRYHFLAQGN